MTSKEMTEGSACLYSFVVRSEICYSCNEIMNQQVFTVESLIRKLTKHESEGLLVNIHTNEFLQRHVYQKLVKMTYPQVQFVTRINSQRGM
jgi:pyruvate-formate lyase-activating enzyme